MIVSFSGIDGAGKTTQINLLLDYCTINNLRCVRKWSKARGTPGIMFLKDLVRRDKGLDTNEKLDYHDKVYKNSWKRELLLMASLLDLLWYWGIYFRVISKKYDVVILDRYIWDTYVEVSSEFHKYNLKRNFLWKCVELVAVKPKESILLVIPPEESLKRDLLKGEITTDELKVKQKKVDLYMEIKKQNCWNVVIDATHSIENVFSEIIKAIWEYDNSLQNE